MNSYVYIISYIINIHKALVVVLLGVCSPLGLIVGSGCSVREGTHCAFTKRPRTLLCMVWFDGTGLWKFSKRLVKGLIQLVAQGKPQRGRVGEHPGYSVRSSAGGHRSAAGLRKAWYER